MLSRICIRSQGRHASNFQLPVDPMRPGCQACKLPTDDEWWRDGNASMKVVEVQRIANVEVRSLKVARSGSDGHDQQFIPAVVVYVRAHHDGWTILLARGAAERKLNQNYVATTVRVTRRHHPSCVPSHPWSDKRSQPTLSTIRSHSSSSITFSAASELSTP